MLNPLKFFSKIIKSNNQRELDRISKIVLKINDFEETVKNLKDTDFPKKTTEFKEILKNGKNLDEILPEAFALVREASRRTRKERHYDVQLIGVLQMHLNLVFHQLRLNIYTLCNLNFHLFEFVQKVFFLPLLYLLKMELYPFQLL